MLLETENKLRETQIALTEAQALNVGLEKEMEGFQTQLRQLSSELGSTRNQVREKGESIREFEGRVERLNQETVELMDVKNRRTEDLAQSGVQITQLSKQLNAARNSIAQVEREKDGFRRVQERIVADFDRAQLDSKDDEAEWNKQIIRLEQKLRQRMDLFNQTQMDLAETQKALLMTQTQIQTLSQEARYRTGALEETQGQLSQLRGDRSKLKESLAHVRRLNAELSQTRDRQDG